MKNKRFDKPFLLHAMRCAAASSLVLSLAIGVGYFFAMYIGFNAEIGHFDPTPWFWIFSAGIALAALIAAVCAFLCRGHGVSQSKKTAASDRIIMIPCAAVALGIFVQFLIGVFTHREAYSLLQKGAGFFVLFISIAFICSAFPAGGSSALTAIAYIFAALAINLNIFASYFNFSIPVNSPVRNVTTIMQCAVLLFMIAEARLALPKESGRSTAVFAAFVDLFTYTVCFGITLASILFRIVRPNASLPNLSAGWLVLFLCISILALVRFLKIPENICPLPSKKEESESEEKE